MSTPLTTRLIETAIIGVLGFMGSYVMIIPRMEEKFNQLDNTVKEVKSEVKQIQRDLYMPRAIPNVQSTQQGGAK